MLLIDDKPTEGYFGFMRLTEGELSLVHDSEIQKIQYRVQRGDFNLVGFLLLEVLVSTW